jgi:hypothetical protein
MSKTLALALLLVFLTASSTILALPVSGVSEAENTWVELAPMHIARAWLGVAAVNGKIYAIGGSTASGFEPASFPYGNINADHFVGTNEEYDPTNNTWSYKAPMPTPRMSFAIAVIQGKIYCIGGRSVAGDMSGGYTSVNELYDPVTNSWENKAPMPIADGWIDAKVIDNRIYIKNNIPSTSSGLYDVYDPASDTWNSSVPSPSDGKLLLDYIPNGYETTGIISSKMVYTFSDYNPTAKAYNPQNDNWRNGVASPIGRTGFGITLANDIFYVVGGYTYEPWGPFAPVATNEEYIPFGYGTPDLSYVLEHTPPQILLQSPLSQTYNESSLPIVFTVNKNITLASYSLDGQQNVTILGDTTIVNIPNGFHNLTIYANDTYGNIGNQTVNFTVEKPQTRNYGNTFTVAVIAISVAIICIVAALLLFRRHRKLIVLSK